MVDACDDDIVITMLAMPALVMVIMNAEGDAGGDG